MCWICQKEINLRNNSVESHIIKHLNARFIYSNWHILPCHIHHKHDKSKPNYICPNCGKLFPIKQRVRAHKCWATTCELVCQKWKCPICGAEMLESNRQKHTRCKHMKKANSNSDGHEVWCVDGFNKIYAVRKSMHGPSSPIHIQVKIHLGTHASIIQCTDPSCSDISRLSTSNVSY